MDFFIAFNYSVNAVCFQKNEHKYGMICAWATQVNFDKVLLLLGGQSITGKNISKGDIIGVSVLATKQENVRDTLGNNHSNAVDKFENLDYTLNESAILINNASIQMVVEVIDVIHLEGIEEDNLVYGVVKSHTQSGAPMMPLMS